jgi:hypothetical protein
MKTDQLLPVRCRLAATQTQEGVGLIERSLIEPRHASHLLCCRFPPYSPFATFAAALSVGSLFFVSFSSLIRRCLSENVHHSHLRSLFFFFFFFLFFCTLTVHGHCPSRESPNGFRWRTLSAVSLPMKPANFYLNCRSATSVRRSTVNCNFRPEVKHWLEPSNWKVAS